ncbi:hypothetical protein BDV27DRAFT_154296 [Aspergillus caelatus]|uniref:Transcription factor domain-containing protein n=1 Tax=Aspergillus caelatus TaxID=61420 RepID=A0A5N7AEI5_9EURO|nr:uncharacterized protein BDV27DRAFT_154296 [Aspergillus caelatus]KAE8368125.1 hypothetical protein BDV27DRAFT_154296 [Aspergillus caelatus]
MAEEFCRRPAPPVDVLEHFVDVYRIKLHLQPLPIFNLTGLTDRLMAGPQYLLWSFLAVVLTFSNHIFYQNTEDIAKDLYSRSSEYAVMKLAWEGDPNPEVIQALCLVALKHIRAQQPTRAWMVIGVGTRLCALRPPHHDGSSLIRGDDSTSRAYWSVFVLERFFLSRTMGLSSAETPEYPESAPLPPPIVAAMGNTFSNSATLSAQQTSPLGRDGIGPPFYRLVSLWGKVGCYMHSLREGELEEPWLPDSTISKLNIELIEHEARVGKEHLLSNLEFSARSAAEIAQYCEYWNPWIAGEILWHAISAILNHPFIHLVVLRAQEGIPQSSGFLQQKCDQALYHASWVFRLIQLTEGLMEIVNPLVGDAVAATATVLWPFQFTRTPKIVQTARDDLIKCDNFLSQMALTWPHMSNKVNIIRKLQALAEKNRKTPAADEATICFQPTLFCSLLDPQFGETVSNGLPNTDLDPLSENDSQSKMHLKTHFVHPLLEEQCSGRQQEETFSAPNSTEDFFMSTDNMDQFIIEELSSHFLQSGLWNMAPDSI